MYALILKHKHILWCKLADTTEKGCHVSCRTWVGINTYYNTFSLPSFVLLVAAAVMYMFTSLIHALLVSVLLVYSDTPFQICLHVLACVHVSNLSTQHTLEMYTPGLPCPKTLLAWSTPPTILSPRIPILRSKMTLCGCWIKWAREKKQEKSLIVFGKHRKSCYNNFTTQEGERGDAILKKDRSLNGSRLSRVRNHIFHQIWSGWVTSILYVHTCTEHATTRGVWGHPPRKVLQFTCSVFALIYGMF